MTECERLIANGTFTRDFFKPEVRCDFLVDEKRKKIWAIEIDLLLQLDRVCKKHGIRYWIEGGTLIGAIRHKGFIPWDDDIDVLMFREDYERLCELKGAFRHPYFLQLPCEDKEYFFAFSKVRNSLTSAISMPFLYREFNQGIGIDIFVMDSHVPGPDAKQRFGAIKKAIVENSTYMRLNHHNLVGPDVQRVKDYPGGDPAERSKWVLDMSMRDSNSDTEYVWLPMGGVYEYEKYVFNRSDFDVTDVAEFEGFHFPIPHGYDRVLRCEYGDYMQLPPKEERGQQHMTSYLDPDVPYKQLVSSLRQANVSSQGIKC